MKQKRNERKREAEERRRRAEKKKLRTGWASHGQRRRTKMKMS
jgi:hypothetical protein